MTYYCGSCRTKGVVTEICQDRIRNSYFICPVEQGRIPKAFLESHALPPTRQKQRCLDEFF